MLDSQPRIINPVSAATPYSPLLGTTHSSGSHPSLWSQVLLGKVMVRTDSSEDYFTWTKCWPLKSTVHHTWSVSVASSQTLPPPAYLYLSTRNCYLTVYQNLLVYNLSWEIHGIFIFLILSLCPALSLDHGKCMVAFIRLHHSGLAEDLRFTPRSWVVSDSWDLVWSGPWVVELLISSLSRVRAGGHLTWPSPTQALAGSVSSLRPSQPIFSIPCPSLQNKGTLGFLPIYPKRHEGASSGFLSPSLPVSFCFLPKRNSVLSTFLSSIQNLPSLDFSLDERN